MSRRPKIVTKHCEPRFWQSLLDGTVLMGSLSNYRKMESTSGLLDDREEGLSANDIVEPMVNFTGELGGNNFVNCNISGGEASVRISHTIDANVFCLSSGLYSPLRHKALLNGNGVDYLANPSCSAFVEYDLERLEHAIRHFSALRFGSEVVSDAVSYAGRNRRVPLANYKTGMSEAARRRHAVSAVFMKPARFACEEEYRIAFNVGDRECQPLLTQRERNDVRRNFAAAISDPGAINPRSA